MTYNEKLLLMMGYNPNALHTFLIVYGGGNVQVINADNEQFFKSVGYKKEAQLLDVTSLSEADQYTFGCLQACHAVHHVGKDALRRWMLITCDHVAPFGNIHGWVNFNTLGQLNAYLTKHNL